MAENERVTIEIKRTSDLKGVKAVKTGLQEVDSETKSRDAGG